MGAQNHFPTPIFQHDVLGFSDQNEKLLAYAKRLQAEDSQGILKSNQGGGWHSSHELDLRDAPEISDIKKVIMDATKLVVDGMGFDGLRLALASMWFIVSPRGASNVRHNHPRAFLSGVYYVRAPAGSSPIRFYDPRSTKLFVQPPGNYRPTPYTSDSVIYETAESRLLIFPGWLDHSVGPHEADGERVSLSFNFMAL